MEYLRLVIKEGKVSANPVKVKGFHQLANLKKCQGCSIIPGIWKLLPKVYSQILHSRCPIEEPSEERYYI